MNIYEDTFGYFMSFQRQYLLLKLKRKSRTTSRSFIRRFSIINVFYMKKKLSTKSIFKLDRILYTPGMSSILLA